MKASNRFPLFLKMKIEMKKTIFREFVIHFSVIDPVLGQKSGLDRIIFYLSLEITLTRRIFVLTEFFNHVHKIFKFPAIRNFFLRHPVSENEK